MGIVKWAGETTRPSVEQQQTSYSALHEILRHALHTIETLAMAVEVVDNILSDLQAVCQDHALAMKDCRGLMRMLVCQKTLLQREHGRALALEGRLRNEVDLVESVVLLTPVVNTDP